MPSLPLSNFASTDKGQRIINLITWLVRECTGLLFIFSGFVKGIDPWGTVYKFNEYLTAVGIPVYHNLVLFGVFLLFTIEFLTGIFLVFGCYRRSVSILSTAIMAFMLILSLWVAVMDPVPDCGCFGDALIISNWATFWKNVILMAFSIWLLKFNTRCSCIITPAFQWIALLFSAVYIIGVGAYGYLVQPMIDFRPFKAGTSLISEESDNVPQFLFIYEKNGERKEFSEDDELPSEDDGWTFVERKEISSGTGSDVSDHEFRIMDRNGDEDVTDEAIASDGRQLLLLIPSVNDISPSTTWKINALYDWADHHDIQMIAIVAAHSGNMSEWEDVSMPRYDIYTADDTVIKELARGNPAVVYLRDGAIVWKTTLSSLNDNDFAEPDTRTDIMNMAPDNENILRNYSWLYLASMAVLVAISFMPRLHGAFRTRRRKVIHDDKAPREE